MTGGIQQIHCSHDIGHNKLHRIGDGTVHMRLSSEVNYLIKIKFFKQADHLFAVHDIGFYKMVIRCFFNIGKVSQIACIK